MTCPMRRTSSSIVVSNFFSIGWRTTKAKMNRAMAKCKLQLQCRLASSPGDCAVLAPILDERMHCFRSCISRKPYFEQPSNAPSPAQIEALKAPCASETLEFEGFWKSTCYEVALFFTQLQR